MVVPFTPISQPTSPDSRRSPSSKQVHDCFRSIQSLPPSLAKGLTVLIVRFCRLARQRQVAASAVLEIGDWVLRSFGA